MSRHLHQDHLASYVPSFVLINLICCAPNLVTSRECSSHVVRHHTTAAPTYAYQDKLPSLPVPPLEETLAKYLRSLQPFEALGAPSFPYTRARDSIVFGLTPLWCAMPGIFSPEEMKRTRALAEEFKAAGGRGQRLQSKLVARSQQKRNWLEEWWYVVLRTLA